MSLPERAPDPRHSRESAFAYTRSADIVLAVASGLAQVGSGLAVLYGLGGVFFLLGGREQLGRSLFMLGTAVLGFFVCHVEAIVLTRVRDLSRPAPPTSSTSTHEQPPGAPPCQRGSDG